MKIILATGIYPPQIGGPATYCRHLAEELTKLGHVVEVVTYGDRVENGKWKVENVSLSLPFLRWWKFARKLREVGASADVVYAFSSVSCGVPLLLSGLTKPKRVLRLGGDFFWERYTDRGGKLSLREWYGSRHWTNIIGRPLMQRILRQFDFIIFSTEFQERMYERAYAHLPEHSVIENALDTLASDMMARSSPHKPFRLFFAGRFVAFKNLFALLAAFVHLPDCFLTLIGEGPLGDALRYEAQRLGIAKRVQFVAPLSGNEKLTVFCWHDLLVLPSFTEISPNTALEARALNVPVLLTEENGLSTELSVGMEMHVLNTPEDIVAAIKNVMDRYPVVSGRPPLETQRSWAQVTRETVERFAILVAQ